MIGRINLGTYRQMVQGTNQVGFYASPGKDAVLDRERWWAQGKPAPVAAAYGLDPLLFLVVLHLVPEGRVGVRVRRRHQRCADRGVRERRHRPPLPANAEIIIEGFSYPDKTAAEGPFGEFTGYYGRPGGATPVHRYQGRFAIATIRSSPAR